MFCIPRKQALLYIERLDQKRKSTSFEHSSECCMCCNCSALCIPLATYWAQSTRRSLWSSAELRLHASVCLPGSHEAQISACQTSYSFSSCNLQTFYSFSSARSLSAHIAMVGRCAGSTCQHAAMSGPSALSRVRVRTRDRARVGVKGEG